MFNFLSKIDKQYSPLKVDMHNKIILFILSFHISLALADQKISDYRKYVKTNSDFRVNEDNLEEALSNLLPMVVLDNRILTAFGVPSLNDVIMEVHKAL